MPETTKPAKTVKKVQKFKPVTTWRNDLDVVQTLSLFPEGNQNAVGYHKIEVVIEPGDEVEIPSEYDHAIHQVVDGTIVGGLAPLLTRVGGEDKLHFSLDVKAQERKLEMEKLIQNKLKEKALQEVLAEQAATIKKL